MLTTQDGVNNINMYLRSLKLVQNAYNGLSRRRKGEKTMRKTAQQRIPYTLENMTHTRNSTITGTE